MGWHTSTGLILQFFGWNWWIVEETKLIVVPRMEFQQPLRILQTQARAYGLENLAGCLIALPIEVGHELAISWKHMLWQPDIWLFVIVVASNLITFLNRDQHLAV